MGSYQKFAAFLVQVALVALGSFAQADISGTVLDGLGDYRFPANQLMSDPYPWPWGVQCPVSWKKMKGCWATVGVEPKTYFEFKVLESFSDGSTYFEVLRYDSQHEVIAHGRGFSKENEKIVKGVLTSDTNPEIRYWIVVTSNLEEDKVSCDRNRTHTVVTLKPLSLNPEEYASGVYFEIEHHEHLPAKAGKKSIRP